MKYFSVCSGVEAASQAWHHLGWEPVAFSEIEPFPCAVLASRFPTVPNLGDMTKITYDKEKEVLSNGTVDIVCRGGIDLLVGGTPCQSFSVAGKRAGLEGASGLAYHYARLIGEIKPRWFVWENVPGSLSSVTYGEQRDFNFLLHAFAVGGNPSLGLRYNCEWRVLDTQYVRVEQFPRAIPQRRRRVFIVGHLATDVGSGRTVLLEQDCVRRDCPPSRVKGKGFARTPYDRAGNAGKCGKCETVGCYENHAQDSRVTEVNVNPTLGASNGDCLKGAQTIAIQGSMINRKDSNGPQGDGIGNEVMFTQNTIDKHAVAIGVGHGGQNGNPTVGEESIDSLTASDYKGPAPFVAIGIGRDAIMMGKNAKFTPSVFEEVQPTIIAKEGGGGDSSSAEMKTGRGVD